jgi:adenosine deaminase
MSAGLSRFLVYMKFTRRMDRSRPSKTLLSVSPVYRWYLYTLMASLVDVFRPIFEVTKDPSTHPELHVFLQRVVGFDTVDDESKVERRIHKKFPFPRLWDSERSPPYSYWCESDTLQAPHQLKVDLVRVYYMYANIASLNNWRRIRGFSTSKTCTHPIIF